MEGKKGKGGESKAGLPPCGLTRGTTSLPVPAAPRAPLRASSLLALGAICPLLPHPSGVKAQGGTPASRRAPFSPMLSAAVPRSLSGVPPFSASSAFLCSKVGVVAGSVWHPVFLCCPCLPPEASLGKEQVVPVDT